jgi:hypothetical protein
MMTPPTAHIERHNPGVFGMVSVSLGRLLEGLLKHVRLRVGIGIFVILFMANVDSMIDTIFNPEMPYVSMHHLIVGGLTASVTTILFGMLSIYVANLKRMMKEVKTLEGLLPICSACHKIRSADDQWHILEKYISERTDATFTHSVCPECAARLYPEMYKNRRTSQQG